jgi:hypothetical protein
LGAMQRTTCGTHVHIGSDSILGSAAGNYDSVARWVRNLVKLTSNVEGALFAMSNSTFRLSATYARSLKPNFSSVDTTSDKDYNYLRGVTGSRVRYQTLNLINLFSPRRSRTVEFRLFAPTLNAAKLVGYVLSVAGICHKAAHAARVKAYNGEAEVGNWRSSLNQLHQQLNWAYRKHSDAVSTRYGASDAVWAVWGEEVLHNQRWNADRFQQHAPSHITSANRSRAW